VLAFLYVGMPQAFEGVSNEWGDPYNPNPDYSFFNYWTPTFHWHPLCMVIAFGVIMPPAASVYRWGFNKDISRTIHGFLQLLAWGFATAGLIIAHKAVDMLIKVETFSSQGIPGGPVVGDPHVTYPHAVVGVFAYSMISLQLLVGIVLYVFKLGSPQVRLNLIPYHRFGGMVAMMAGVAAANSGLEHHVVAVTGPNDPTGPLTKFSGLTIMTMILNVASAMFLTTVETGKSDDEDTYSRMEPAA